jgi:hypothetical protein
MSALLLSTAEQVQVRSALLYWATHWDWECPTLFGIELEDLQGVLQTWPNVGPQQENEGLAVIGALRELLYGASTPPRSQLTAILGLEYEAASALCEKIYSLYRKDST